MHDILCTHYLRHKKCPFISENDDITGQFTMHVSVCKLNASAQLKHVSRSDRVQDAQLFSQA